VIRSPDSAYFGCGDSMMSSITIEKYGWFLWGYSFFRVYGVGLELSTEKRCAARELRPQQGEIDQGKCKTQAGIIGFKALWGSESWENLGRCRVGLLHRCSTALGFSAQRYVRVALSYDRSVILIMSHSFAQRYKVTLATKRNYPGDPYSPWPRVE